MTTRVLAYHPEWVRPDFASGDRRFASLLGHLQRRTEVDLLQLGIRDPSRDGERLAILRQYFHGRLLPDKVHMGGQPLFVRPYSILLFEFWSLAKNFLEVARSLQPWAAVVVDTVDVHYVREEAAARLGLMDPKVVESNKRRELQVYRQADAVLVVTEDDRRALLAEGISVPIFVVPNIVPLQERPARQRSSEVLFVGGFGHVPNLDGVLWFVKECWATVHEQIPDATLTIIGGDAPDQIKALQAQPGIRLEGRVPDTRPYLERAAVSIAPLRFGGGLKGKVCEALAAGMPLVSTSAGVAGLSAHHQTHAWITDDAAEFANGVIACLRDKTMAHEMGGRGREMIADVCGDRAIEQYVAKMLDGLGPHQPTFMQKSTWWARRAKYFLRRAVRQVIPKRTQTAVRQSGEPAGVLRASDAKR